MSEAWAVVLTGERLRLRLNGVAAHRIALQRVTLRSNTELLIMVADSAREFESTGVSRRLDPDLTAPRIAALTQVIIALDNKFLDANPIWR
ncbi:hypothetical protein F1D05_17980 [Kribbella qitaiheensis]|uniref:Uncharacterized protein n=1 Tax=Kribbella qitaiheensis TaxID=1544730 RepID=A0A7G6WZP2_9ACTN|nr:hypothetical protein [Kribbella qitaiheensis]QNE19457.1 hypothetical protein F1D05_17980 [Kribbella qitaiheensis]